MKNVVQPALALPASIAKASLLIRAMLGCALLPALALANPSGEQVKSGQAEFDRTGSTLTVTQSSGRAIIHWQDFSIGHGDTTRFVQPSRSSATLNRVVGGNLSAIHGNLQANGQVYLINPNGVLIGSSGVIQTAGFIASTHDVSNAAFLAGGDLTFTPGSAAAGSQVVNLGVIDVDGGDVFLIAETVRNDGSIRAGGTVGLVAAGGAEVLISPGGEEKILVRPLSANSESDGNEESGGSVVNSSTIESMQAELRAVGGNAYALAIENSGVVRATGTDIRDGRVMLSAGGNGGVTNSGTLQARNNNGSGGGIQIAAGGSVANDGHLDASGTSGGEIAITGSRGSHTGTLDTSGSMGDGGTISITMEKAYHDTRGAILTAAGADNGGSIRVEATNADSRVYSSSTMNASGAADVGGDIVVTADELYLMGSILRVDGAKGGGILRAGGGFQGADPEVANASSLYVNQSATLTANATDTGDGGTVVLWAEGTTDFLGRIEAQGGSFGGDGGFMEVSGKESLRFGGFATAAAPAGQAGTLLLDPKNITVDTFNSEGSPILFEFIDPNKAAGNVFGDSVAPLSSGNVVITSSGDDFNAANSGAVYLFDGSNGTLISTLRGTTANDQVGRDGITTLSNGNFVIKSSVWNGSRGAVTWGDGAAGVMGVVSAANSLVGTNADDRVGVSGVTSLSNGNYVVSTPTWNGNRGAVTWGNGSTGVSGEVSVGNSLVGSNADDRVGASYGLSGATPLNNGNYVVLSVGWNGNRGAATWGNGSTGITGEVSAANSLVGTNAGDEVGRTLTALTNGNYVMSSDRWNGNRGAVTWGNGSTGITGEVSALNSLVGTVANSFVGGRVYVLSNGNYVVNSTSWNGARGAVTWADGSMGITGEVSAANSLVGTNANDSVGTFGVWELSNGNYVVRSSTWNNNRGAVTWADGSTGITGEVSAVNSLVGTNLGDLVGLEQEGPFLNRIIPLANGNYVVNSGYWNGNRGAVTWGDGSTGITGEVSAANSLVGTDANDFVGTGIISRQIDGVYGRITLLPNGNYLVSSPEWNGTRGAVTLGDGNTGVVGTVSAVNSLVGTDPDDSLGSSGFTLLTNSNYVVNSPSWNGNRGAATWGHVSTATTGAVSAANSLVGSNPGDQVGFSSGNFSTIALTNGNYVVGSYNWNGGRGAATWGDGSTGTVGVVSAANSLVGTDAGDYVGGNVVPLSNGNYLVRSTGWNGNRGAVTLANGSTGISGEISAVNSLIGTTAGDRVGGGTLTALTNGNFVVGSPLWNSNRGAMTWVNGSTGISGEISSANSLVGTNVDDYVGGSPVTELSNGNFVVTSSSWNGARGAVTWGNGNTGVIGEVSAANSFVGTNAGDQVSDGYITELSNGNYLVLSSQWGDTRGAVTWGNGNTGSSGEISAANSILGGNPAAPFFPFGFILDPVNETFLSGFIMDTSGGAGGRVYASSIHGPGPVSGLLFGDAPGKSVTITASRITDITNTGTGIILQANNDITVNSPIITGNPSGNGGAITMQAGRSILLNANVTTDNGDLTLVANETLANGVIDAHRDPGDAEVTMAAGRSINAGTGTVSITMADGAGKTHSGAGEITLRDINAASILVENLGAGGGADLVLNGILTGSGTGDAITLAGRQFHNQAGAAALNAPNGRWLIFAGDVSGNTFGGLNSGNQALWNIIYGSNIAPAGNRYIFANQPALTFTTTDATKSFGDDLTGSVGTQFMVSGFVNASAHGNVFTQDTLANTTTGTAVASSAGADPTASVDGSPYGVTVDISSVSATTGYTLAKVESGELTVTANQGPSEPGPSEPGPSEPMPSEPPPRASVAGGPTPIEPPQVPTRIDTTKILGDLVRKLGDNGYPLFRFLLLETEKLRFNPMESGENSEDTWLVRLSALLPGSLD